MRSSIPRELPRPEDRRRGDLEYGLGCSAEQPGWRSEAFAEDLPAVAPLLAAAAPLRHRDRRWSAPQAFSFTALSLSRPR